MGHRGRQIQGGLRGAGRTLQSRSPLPGIEARFRAVDLFRVNPATHSLMGMARRHGREAQGRMHGRCRGLPAALGHGLERDALLGFGRHRLPRDIRGWLHLYPLLGELRPRFRQIRLCWIPLAARPSESLHDFPFMFRPKPYWARYPPVRGAPASRLYAFRERLQSIGVMLKNSRADRGNFGGG